ncbi:MAG TPA: hypothetical protein VHI13_05205 [Candidatus Kapabacteria bacterium]|nr:hypothetical protein [Candidatus Kapabacteria bacterium]
MKSIAQRCRSAALAAFTVCMLITTLTIGHAQCPCPTYTLTISPALACSVTVCHQLSPSGPIVCTPLAPGESISLPCADWASNTIQLCNGGFFVLPGPGPMPPPGTCSRTLGFARGCCGQVCRPNPDATICGHLEVVPAPCPVTECL